MPSLRLPAIFAPLLAVLLLGACAKQQVIEEEPQAALGNFKLGYAIVVTNNLQKVPISREASAEDWKAALQKAVDERLKRYDGDKFYNLGISIDAYALAPPGVPLVLSPKSVVAVTVTAWDDAARAKLNEKPEQLIVFEGLDGETMIGSGLTRSADQQMERLAYNAAARIERYLADNPEWFGLPPKPVQQENNN